MIAKMVIAEEAASAFGMKSCTVDRNGQAIETIGRSWGGIVPKWVSRAHGDYAPPFSDIHGD
jgi:hypothetical protein